MEVNTVHALIKTALDIKAIKRARIDPRDNNKSEGILHFTIKRVQSPQYKYA